MSSFGCKPLIRRCLSGLVRGLQRLPQATNEPDMNEQYKPGGRGSNMSLDDEDYDLLDDEDTVVVRKLQGPLQVLPERIQNTNPYNTDETPLQSFRKTRRRSLDDMRKLSEEIKRQRAAQNAKK